MAQRERWTLDDFIAQFSRNITPEGLAIVLADALEELEHGHRQGKIHGALRVSDIVIESDGRVRIEGWGRGSESGVARGERPTAGTDVQALGSLFMRLMPDGQRLHPELKKLLRDSLREKPLGAWTMRGRLLDFLATMGLEGEPFFTAHFISDPLDYVRRMTVVLAEREYRRIRALSTRGRRRRAVAELHYLLEIAPVNRQALTLWRHVKQGRRRMLAHLMYGFVVLIVLVATGSVIAEKLGIQSEQRPNALVIEPLAEPSGSLLRGRQIATENGTIELSSTNHPVVSGPDRKRGAVVLDLDDDAKAYFDSSPDSGRAHGDRDTVWLPSGSHTVTVVKPGLPPAMAHITVRPDQMVELGGHVISR